MCKEEDQCTYKLHAPPEPRGFWALAASNKHIRNEAQEFFLQNTVVSIHPDNLHPWLDHLAKHSPEQLEHLRRITIAGPNSNQLQDEFSLLLDRIPNLQGVGVQLQDSAWRWVTTKDSPFNRDAWKKWYMVHRMHSRFDTSITIAIEAMVWIKVPIYSRTPEQQVAVRILREGEEGKLGARWQFNDFKVEFDEPGRLVAYEQNAKWREWWEGSGMSGLVDVWR